MATTYDNIYDIFMSITHVDEIYYPQTEVGIKRLIRNGIRIYNQKMFANLKWDDNKEIVYDEEKVNIETTYIEIPDTDPIEYETEEKVVYEDLENSHVSLIAECMKLITFKNMESDFISTYSTYSKEMGIKDYKAQLDGKMALVKNQEKEIESIVFSLSEKVHEGE